MSQPPEASPYFLTSDLALATTLSLQFPIEDIDRSNVHKAVFVFRRSPELEVLADQYFSNQIKVAPQVFFNQLREVKARLYAERNIW